MGNEMRDGEGAAIPAPRRAGIGDDDLDAEAMVRRAEAAVEALKAAYPAWVERHFAGLEQACERARVDPGDRNAEFETIARIAHDIKGEGGSYGYPLMTTLGASLYRFVRAMGVCGDDRLDIVETHIAAMRTVIRDRLEGDGGAVGTTLVAALEKAVASR